MKPLTGYKVYLLVLLCLVVGLQRMQQDAQAVSDPLTNLKAPEQRARVTGVTLTGDTARKALSSREISAALTASTNQLLMVPARHGAFVTQRRRIELRKSAEEVETHIPGIMSLANEAVIPPDPRRRHRGGVVTRTRGVHSSGYGSSSYYHK